MEIFVFYNLIRGHEIQIPSQFSGSMALIGATKPFHKHCILHCQKEVSI